MVIVLALITFKDLVLEPHNCVFKDERDFCSKSLSMVLTLFPTGRSPFVRLEIKKVIVYCIWYCKLFNKICSRLLII